MVAAFVDVGRLGVGATEENLDWLRDDDDDVDACIGEGGWEVWSC